MCGIAGIIKLDGATPPTRLARRLIYQISERGGKATGYACVIDGRLKVVKDKLGAKEFIEGYGDELRRDLRRTRAWICHSRQPTKGTVDNPTNNHPVFSKSGLAVVHNGVIWNTDEVFERFELERDGEVDSEVILKLIEHQRRTSADIREMITQAVKYLDGSLTFALIDEANPNEVWLHRWGYSAPLSVAVLDRLMVFASELEHIFGAVGKKSKDFFTLPKCAVRTLKDGELMRVNGAGVERYKTKPESEAIKRKWWEKPETKVSEPTTKGDPDDGDIWAGTDGDIWAEYLCPECGSEMERDGDKLICYFCGLMLKIVGD